MDTKESIYYATNFQNFISFSYVTKFTNSENEKA